MENFSALISEYLKKYPMGEFRENEPMRAHTTLRIGGEVRVMFFPKTDDEVGEILSLCENYNARHFILGNGSNLLFSDEKLPIAVINMENLKNVRVDGETVDADAGVTLSKIAFEAYTKSLTGFEFAQGIPGTLGGGVYMNAGAYGSEMKDVIESVTAYSKDKGIVTFSNDECCFGYRKSVFTDSDYVILRAKIKLKIGNKDEIKSQMDTLSDKRRKSQPLELPSAGSTFKRPQTGYAAAMIDAAGLKGFSVGGAQVSEKHGGFVVNKGGATFDDFMAVVRHVQETVYKDTGVMLEPEVKIIH